MPNEQTGYTVHYIGQSGLQSARWVHHRMESPGPATYSTGERRAVDAHNPKPRPSQTFPDLPISPLLGCAGPPSARFSCVTRRVATPQEQLMRKRTAYAP